MLAEEVILLREELHTRGAGYVQRFTAILEKIAQQSDPSSIPLLLPVLQDDAEYEELMFSIIHAMECFDDVTYVKAITDNIVSFFARSPRWAVIVHKRILNSPATLGAYTDSLKTLSADKLEIVREILEAVKKNNPQFAIRCNALKGVFDPLN